MSDNILGNILSNAMNSPLMNKIKGSGLNENTITRLLNNDKDALKEVAQAMGVKEENVAKGLQSYLNFFKVKA